MNNTTLKYLFFGALVIFWIYSVFSIKAIVKNANENCYEDMATVTINDTQTFQTKILICYDKPVRIINDGGSQ